MFKRLMSWIRGFFGLFIKGLEQADANKKKEIYIGVLSSNIRKSMDYKKENTVDIILDTPPLKMDKELEKMVNDLVKSGYNIRWFETDSSASNKSLMTHDYVTGTIADHVEGKQETKGLYERIKHRIRGE